MLSQGLVQVVFSLPAMHLAGQRLSLGKPLRVLTQPLHSTATYSTAVTQHSYIQRSCYIAWHSMALYTAAQGACVSPVSLRMLCVIYMPVCVSVGVTVLCVCGCVLVTYSQT